ncbi:MAG: hypothetical protein QXE81_04710 [Desulfurococcaceae archaeon]
MVFYKGKIKEAIIKDHEVYIYGLFNTQMILGDDKVVLIGGGKSKIVVGKECFIYPMKKTIIIGLAYCSSILSMGSRYAVLINHVVADKVYTKRTYIVELDANHAVLGELSIIERFKAIGNTIFTDPHLYIKDIFKISKVYYAYKIID